MFFDYQGRAGKIYRRRKFSYYVGYVTDRRFFLVHNWFSLYKNYNLFGSFGGKTEITPNKKILCVEDHEDTCELYKLLLPEYDFTFADSIESAIKLFEENHFDLCITDGRLCDGTGASLCRRMLELKPDFPVVFVSGLTRDSDIEEAKIAGAKEYLVKPCDTEELQKIVKELIGN